MAFLTKKSHCQITRLVTLTTGFSIEPNVFRLPNLGAFFYTVKMLGKPFSSPSTDLILLKLATLESNQQDYLENEH